MNGYHWFVLLVAALGWMFDCLDQQFFVLGRPAAMRELLRGVSEPQFDDFSKHVKEAAPSQVPAADVDAFLVNVKDHLAVIERRKFWPIEQNLSAQWNIAGDPSAQSQALRQANDALAVATDNKVFEATIAEYANYATAIFLLGWATGGLIFGVLGDRIGRAKTMLVTILIYSAFTGACAFSQNFLQFAIFRFLTDLGVGGEFAVGVALVAETMPTAARAPMLTLLQMLSTVGNMTAALINIQMGVWEGEGAIGSPWRKMFLVGALPALVAVLIRWKLKEPERWKQLSAEEALEKQLGSYRGLFRDPRWRRNALCGLALALSGVIGLWAVGFFTPDLTKTVLKTKLTNAAFDEEIAAAQGDTVRASQLSQLQANWGSNAAVPAEMEPLRAQLQKKIDGQITRWGGISSICFQIGAFCGMFCFGFVAQRLGRKPSFAIALIGACVITSIEFIFLDDFSQLFWLIPMVGFFQLSLFAGYAIYLPELFPTSLRSTGTSFCYNVGRFLAAPTLFLKGQLSLLFA
ncbi:MAG TPA: MFS transporter, partial [Pirellulales bacterium]